MARYLDFEKEEKDYKPFSLTTENIKNNIGKQICYVDYCCPHRGTYYVRYASISGKYYSKLLINDNSDSIDIRNILECGIKKEENEDTF